MEAGGRLTRKGQEETCRVMVTLCTHTKNQQVVHLATYFVGSTGCSLYSAKK